MQSCQSSAIFCLALVSHAWTLANIGRAASIPYEISTTITIIVTTTMPMTISLLIISSTIRLVLVHEIELIGQEAWK